ncbi:MAG: cyclic nucleotide-binding domain-containing protein, partial [Myxococcota bacterium]
MAKVARLRDKLNQALRKEQLADALALYEKLEAAEPEEPRWPHRNGDLLRRMDRTRDAIDAFAEASRRYVGLGFVARAVAVAKVVLQIDPGRTDILEAVDPAAAKALHSKLPKRTRTASVDLVPVLQVDATEDGEALIFLDASEDESVELVLSETELLPVPPPPPSEVMELGDDDLMILEVEETPRRAPLERLAKLPTMPLFAELPDPIRKRLFAGAELVETKAGELLVRTGDAADGIFVIVEGEAEIRVPGAANAILLGEGDVVGEGALLDDVERRADVAAYGQLQTLFVRKTLLDALVLEHPPLGEILLELLGRRSIANVLETSPVIGGFDGATRVELAKLFELRRAVAGTVLVQAGKRADGLFVVLLGRLQNEAGRLLGPGATLGQRSLITREPAQTTWRATTDVLLLRAPATRFTMLAATFPPVLARLSELAGQGG